MRDGTVHQSEGGQVLNQTHTELVADTETIAALPSFCIALPVCNEAAVIERCVENIAQFLDTVDVRTGIIAVDDGSHDDSYELMHRMQARLPQLILHRQEHNSGYGGANRTLCKLAAKHEFTYTIVMDADGTQDPKYIANFFPLMLEGVDFIKATRYRLGGSVDSVSWRRRVISRFGNLLAQVCMDLPLSDFSNGFRCIRTNMWQEIKSTEQNFEVLIEECYLARKLGFSFGEVPYILSPGGSKIRSQSLATNGQYTAIT